jgi:hypothetical protein
MQQPHCTNDALRVILLPPRRSDDVKQDGAPEPSHAGSVQHHYSAAAIGARSLARLGTKSHVHCTLLAALSASVQKHDNFVLKIHKSIFCKR